MNSITVVTIVGAPITKVWDMWTKPEHIVHWNFASDDWECPHAENDLRIGGKFKCVMAAKDKSARFDFEGTYTRVEPEQLIEYSMTDGRHVVVTFEATENGVKVTETFDPEHENTEELQQQGWQAILDNFKKYVETNLT